VKKKRRIALIGDYNESVTAHRAIPQALRLAGEALDVEAEGVWLNTAQLRDPEQQLREFDGAWCVPASPYANPAGALAAIRYLREQQVPFLGSCGGFQHAAIEYARNFAGIRAANHAESDPTGEALVITALACSLVEKSEEIRLAESGILRKAYGVERITEGYRCSYGFNPAYEQQLFCSKLRPTGWGASGEVRAFELQDHPFFVGTLFQSERRALKGEAPPLVMAFLNAM
jgi:CTP synthase (UTP-ammonia lyase)